MVPRTFRRRSSRRAERSRSGPERGRPSHQMPNADDAKYAKHAGLITEHTEHTEDTEECNCHFLWVVALEALRHRTKQNALAVSRVCFPVCSVCSVCSVISSFSR